MKPFQLLTPDWPAPPQVKAFTTTRIGGYSIPPFAEFNLSFSSGDDLDTVRRHRDRIKHILSLPEEPRWLKQVHGNQAIVAETIQPTTEADASFTNQPNTVCVILTADCLPIALCDQAGTQVAVIHGGWRSLAKQIIPLTVQKLSTTNPLMAWLGPAISAAYFEVGQEVYEQFIATEPMLHTAFTPTNNHTWLADLYAIARQQLEQCGITAVYGGQYCTYRDETLFYSYRRNGITGRMATLIWLSA